MPTFEIEYDYIEYEMETFVDNFEEEDEQEVEHYYTEVVYIEAEDADEAIEIAKDDLYYKEGLSVRSAKLVEDDE